MGPAAAPPLRLCPVLYCIVLYVMSWLPLPSEGAARVASDLSCPAIASFTATLTSCAPGSPYGTTLYVRVSDGRLTALLRDGMRVLDAETALVEEDAYGSTSVECAAGWRCGRRPRCHCKRHARLHPQRLLLPRSSLSSTLPPPTPPPTRPPLSASARCQRYCPCPRPTLAASALPRCGPCCCRCCALPASNELPELPPALPVARAPPGAHRPPRGRARGPRTGGAAGSRAGAADSGEVQDGGAGACRDGAGAAGATAQQRRVAGQQLQDGDGGAAGGSVGAPRRLCRQLLRLAHQSANVSPRVQHAPHSACPASQSRSARPLREPPAQRAKQLRSRFSRHRRHHRPQQRLLLLPALLQCPRRCWLGAHKQRRWRTHGSREHTRGARGSARARAGQQGIEGCSSQLLATQHEVPATLRK